MSFNVNLPLGRSNSMSGLTGPRLTSKDPSTLTNVVYDQNDRVKQATYTLVDGTSETLLFEYNDHGLVYNDIEYRGYEFDLFSAQIIQEDPAVAAEAHLESMCVLRSIEEQLMKLNTYMAIITNTDL